MHAAAEARASVLTLITVVESESRYRSIARVLTSCRPPPIPHAGLLAQEERVAMKLEAGVVAEAHLDSGHRVFTEQVLLHAHGAIAEHLASPGSTAPDSGPAGHAVVARRPEFEAGSSTSSRNSGDRLVVDTDEGFAAADLAHLLQVARVAVRLCDWRLQLGAAAALAQLAASSSTCRPPWPPRRPARGDRCGTGRMAPAPGAAPGRLGGEPDGVGGDYRGPGGAGGPGSPAGRRPLMLYSDGPDGRSRFSITKLPAAGLATETRAATRTWRAHGPAAQSAARPSCLAM